MKKNTFLFLTLLSFSFSQAQIVNIPDTDFKNALLSYNPPIDTNHDNEIQVSEALAVTALNFISGNYANHPHNLTGVEAFSNITLLYIESSNLTSVDVSSLSNLHNVRFSCSNLTSLNVSGLVNLQSLYLEGCYALPSLNLAGLSNLQYLECAGCSQLTSLDLTGSLGLQTLNCRNCYQMTSLNINGLGNLTSLNCNSSSLTSLNLTGLTNLQVLDCGNNHSLTSLDLTGLSNLTSLDCSQCYQMTSLITTGANNITNLNCSMNHLSTLNVSGMTNLQNLDCSHQTDGVSSGILTLDLTGLNFITGLNCSSNSLTSLDVSHLTGLTYLSCSYNQIATLNVTPLVNLINLFCAGNQLQTLDVSTLVHLSNFDCHSNLLNALNITSLTDLTHIDCGQNSIDALDVSNNTALTFLACAGNELTSLDITTVLSLEHLICSANQITTIDFSNSHHLIDVQAGGNLFTTVDLSQSSLSGPFDSHFSLDENPNLTYINLKNGVHNFSPSFFSANNCPVLQYICSDDFNTTNIQQALVNFGFPSTTPQNVQVNSYCSFVPGGINNIVNGTITLDSNNNGCGPGDIHPKDVRININDGTSIGATFSITNGSYSFFTQTGNFSLTPVFENPYFTISPANATINFATLDGSTQTQDYCITPNGVHNDIDITIIPSGNARPGFDSSYTLVYKNKGNQTLSGNINLAFDDAVLDFVSAMPALDSQSLNNLSWNYANLFPFESRTIYFNLNLNGPTETPAVNIGDVLNFVATVNPISGDETPSDNVSNLTQIVRGSFDPNDKICLEGNYISPERIGDYVHYIIHFQNSGTAPAENIVVKDLIDSAKFDIGTLQLTATSHPQVTRITENKVEFVFEGINLPAEIDNEPASHGYVAFKIKTKNNLVLGNTISNTADIYFDYNFPIVTNTATSTVSTLNNHDFENTSVSIFPNPVKNILSISANDMITSIQLFDVQGRLISTKLNTDLQANLDLSQQTTGVYFVKVYTANGVKVQKVIKE